MWLPRRPVRDPVERVWSLYDKRREEIDGRGWSLADVYLELGGGGPCSSVLHGEFSEFFNGQARAILAPWQASKLEYWAGIPERGAALRDEALEILARHRNVDAAAVGARSRPDPRARSLILAHNQIDAELHLHFAGAVDRPVVRPSTSRQGTAVCVLGMSRSGTSVTARILNALGVDLGSEGELMEPAAGNNPSGFWEHKGIADLNEDILATLGNAPRQAWRWPPSLDEGWERDPRLEPHRRAARSILQESFAGLPLWGWKDPRTCLTLPFWQRLLTEMRQIESRMRYVICVRHPFDVADSLEARDGMGREEAVRLWLRYMSQAILHTSGCPRVFVSYEGYFPGWERQVRRLAEFLSLPPLSETQRTTIANHLDEGQWHHRQAKQGADTATEANLPPGAGDLHALLTERCDRHPKSEPAMEADLDSAARRVARLIAQA